MPTVTSENKAEFDRQFLKKKGLLKEKNNDEMMLEKGKEYEFHNRPGKMKYLGYLTIDGNKKQHRFKGEGPNSYRSLLDHELEKHLKR